MAIKHDTLQLLKAKYLEKLRVQERTLAALKEKVRLIEELEDEAEGLAATVAATTKYETLGLTKAVEDAIQTIGTNGGASVTNVGKHLLAQGFKPKGKNFFISVGQTLKRLAKSERISTKSEAGHRFYMPK